MSAICFPSFFKQIHHDCHMEFHILFKWFPYSSWLPERLPDCLHYYVFVCFLYDCLCSPEGLPMVFTCVPDGTLMLFECFLMVFICSPDGFLMISLDVFQFHMLSRYVAPFLSHYAICSVVSLIILWERLMLYNMGVARAPKHTIMYFILLYPADSPSLRS